MAFDLEILALLCKFNNSKWVITSNTRDLSRFLRCGFDKEMRGSS